ncbi:hypothetical protein A4A49_65971 [Nicotiana attenuata]|uniref:ER membrane protein complex subunit 3 n=1 Tax=Nicotiana attenuata TaxID=49451 RepID=A0A1J6KG22_NICAT|nr:hypothetical protein A4A49_65971 [Nicotiana attenuata]
MAEDLVLDTAIRDWVLILLSVVMVLIGILRYFVSKLMRSSTQAPPGNEAVGTKIFKTKCAPNFESFESESRPS